jgi:VanZ family protein
VPLWIRLKSWLPAIAWAGLISILSTDVFSSEHTSRFIVPALHWLFPAASGATLELLHAIIRKSAHVTEYFIFSIFLIRALRGKDRGWHLRWAIWAVVIAGGYSTLDEFHQSFVASRTASPWDALLDTAGASAAQVVLGFWHLWRARGTTKAKTVAGEDSRARDAG